MKKNKIVIVVGLIVLLMAGGLILTACGSKCKIEAGGCGYAFDRDGNIRDITICAESSCRVAKDVKDFEEKPGACDCK